MRVKPFSLPPCKSYSAMLKRSVLDNKFSANGVRRVPTRTRLLSLARSVRQPVKSAPQAQLTKTAPQAPPIQQKGGKRKDAESSQRKKLESKPHQWQTNIETDKTRGGLSKRQTKRAKGDEYQRLAKVVAQAGIASRRKAEELVESGTVKVNGRTILMPQHMVLPTIDEVVVNGKPLPRSTKKYYFALNKPKGYLCSSKAFKEQEKAKLVVDLFKVWLDNEWRPRHPHPNAQPPRLFTVGRLDVQTTGLLFVTNDGDWAQQVIHPSKNVTKEYVVTFSKEPTRVELESLALGCDIDGILVQPVSLGFAAPDRKDKLRIVVSEGRNREVRRLSENAGLEVISLKRTRVGGFRIPKDLGLGEFRELKPYHVKRVSDRA